jgi:hypothetical protein
LPFILGEEGELNLQYVLTNKTNGQSDTRTTVLKINDNNKAPEIVPEYNGVVNVI